MPEPGPPDDAGADGFAEFLDDDFGNEPAPWDDMPDSGIICEGCGEEIVETKSSKGTVWSPEAIQGYSQKTYGSIFCPGCQKRANSGGRTT